MSNASATSIAGEDLLLSAERAIYWPRREMLLIADSHFAVRDRMGFS